MTPRERIARIIRALRAKTVENGCTEGEAVAAAAKLAAVLAEHDMTLDEAELREQPFAQHDEAHEDDVGKRLWKPAVAIEALTGARHWTSAAGVWPIEHHFFGFAHEVDVAAYLLEICARAMRDERAGKVRACGLRRPAAVRNVVNPFLDGMADRLRERIFALIPPKPTGTGLVVVKGELIDVALAEAGIEIVAGGGGGRNGQRGGAEYELGRRAADQVALNPGLRASPATGQIEARR